MGAKMGYKPRKREVRLCSKRKSPAIPIGRLHALPFEADSPNSATGKLWNLACIQGLVVANLGPLRQPPGGRTNNKVLSPFLRPRLRLIPPPLPPRFLSLVRGAKIISSRPKKPSLSHSRYSPRSLSCSSPFSSLSIPQQLWLSFSYISSPLRASLCTVLCTVYVSYRGCGATRIAPLRK